MKERQKVVVVGLGEVGKPLFELARRHHDVIGVDIEPPKQRIENVDVLHICFPFEIKDFIGETARYIELFRPAVTIINSTVGVGTTRAIAERKRRGGRQGKPRRPRIPAAAARRRVDAHPASHRAAAGVENAKGILSSNYLKDPTDPTWKDATP